MGDAEDAFESLARSSGASSFPSPVVQFADHETKRGPEIVVCDGEGDWDFSRRAVWRTAMGFVGLL